MAVCAQVNAQAMAVSLDSLGERVEREEDARAAAEVYRQVLDAMAERARAGIAEAPA